MRILSNSKLFIMTFMSLGLVATQVHADPFTLEAAKAMATQQDGVQFLEQARLEAEATKGDAEAARAQRFGALSASGGIAHESLIGGASGTYATHTIGYTIPFFNNAITTDINSTKFINLSAQQTYQAQMNQALLQVAVGYYNIVKANKDILVAQDNLKNSTDYYNAEANAAHGAGVGDPTDADTAQVQVTLAQKSLNLAKQAKANACVALITLIGDNDPATNKPNLADCDRVIDPQNPTTFSVDQDKAIDIAQKSRPEVAADQDLVSSQQAIADGIGGWKNHVTVSGGVQNGSPGTIPGAPNMIGGGLDPFHPGNTNSAGVNVQISLGWTDKGQKYAANQRVGIAQSGVTQEQRQVSTDVVQAIAAVDEAYAQQANAKLEFSAAKNALASKIAKVRAGALATNSTDYVQALRDYANAEQDLYESEPNIALSIAQLQAALGAPNQITATQFLGQSGILTAPDSIIMKK